MKKIHIELNKILNQSNNEVILKGVNINSPCVLKYQENHDFLEDIKNIKKIGANAITVPICPAYFQSRENYCEDILDPIVSLCKELNMYCLLDWHGQGNPITGETRQPGTLIEGYMKYDARPEIAKKTAEILAKRYGNESHVLFEILSALYLGINGKEWVEFASSIVSIIRKYSENIVVIAAMNWPQNLNALFDNQFEGNNIVFGIMIYPGSKDLDKINVKKLKENHAIIITECGYERLNPKEEMMKSTREEYALPLKKFIIENGFSWFAWCYHPVRQPVMLNSYSPEDFSEWGKFVKDELLK
ncbi:MAG: Endoglucanase [Parcubacteria group bacterium Athens0714_16]|nr:MAG: Endoglucanase [Parcubacteria group bacterium Athens0714_16]